MPREARIETRDGGKVATTDGWYVLHVSEARWRRNERFGTVCSFEGDVRFPEIGVNIRVVEPGQPACLYHRENAQENFLVLSGECLLLIEEEERPLRAGDFVHCPPEVRHVFVGAGDGPCAILMIGYRASEEELLYPVSDVAAKYGASAEDETDDPRVAYGSLPVFSEPGDSKWPLY